MAFVNRGSFKSPQIVSVSNSSENATLEEESLKVELFKNTNIDKHWCEFKLKYNKIYNDCSIEQERYNF